MLTSQLTSRARSSLPFTDLGWVQIHDHFKATVGPLSGTGHALSSLVVLADATLPPHARFPLHAHEHMEIVSVVLEGALLHTEPDRQDVLPANTVQWISAGSGIVHAEGNAGATPVRMLQIWIRPDARGGTPRYGVAPLPVLGAAFRRISPDGLRSSTMVAMARLAAGETTELRVPYQHVTYLLFVDGDVQTSTVFHQPGDGALASAGTHHFSATGDARIVAITIPL